MKLTACLKKHTNSFVTVCVAVILVVAQVLTFAVVAAPAGTNPADTAAVQHLEQLYKAYINEYGDKTTREGLLRVYDSALQINSDSFAAEKADGYEVELSATVIRPVDGAKDADGEIVPAYNGFVNINAVVKKGGNEVGTVNLTEEIEAEVKTLTYTKSSASEGASVWNIGLGKYLNRYTGDADKLVIPEGVEEINWDNRKTWYQGDKTKVKIIVFPSTMKKMITETLQGFTNLVAVYVPDGCVNFGSNVFEGCTSLRFVRLPEGMTVIPAKTFAGTPALTSLHIPTTVTSVSDYAFNGSAIRDIVIVADDFVGKGYDTHKNFVLTLNDGINAEIKDDVKADLTDDQGFNACRQFFYLGKNPTVESSWLWYSCDIANGADYLWYTYIYALKNNSIESFIATQTSNSLADEYTALDEAAAKKLKLQHSGVSGIVFEDSDVLAHLEELYRAYIEKYGDKTTREGLLRVYDNAFEVNSDSFSKEKAAGFEVKLSATVLRPVDGSRDADGIITTPRDGYANINATVTQDGRAVGTVKFTQPIPAELKTLTYEKSSESEGSDVWEIGGGKYLNRYTGDADKIVIPEGIEEIASTSIGDWYKGDKTKVKIIVYPSTMKKIMPYTMQGFTNLIAVYMPDTCTEIGQFAFDDCTSLRFLRISENIESIPEKCFRNTPALTMLYLPASVKEVADASFNGSAVRDIVITRNAFIGNGYDTHKGYVTALKDGINEQVKDDVKADLTDDRDVVSDRHFYYLGKKYNVTSDWLWYSCDMANGPDYLWYTYIYARKGGSIEDFIDKQTSNSLEDEYTPLDTETVEMLIKQHDEYMMYGRYPKDVSTDDVQAIIDTYTFDNKCTASDFERFLEKALGDTGYKAQVSDWYKLRAVAGCKDQDGVMFDGYKGYVTATVTLTAVGKSAEISVYGVINPEMYEYTFESVAQADEFYPETVDGIDGLRGDTETEDEFFLLSQDGKILIDYFGSAEKIIIPEGVEYLDQAWWLDTDLTAVRCIILPDSLKALPDQFGVPFSSSLEVVIMGDNVTVAEGKHAFWKCYRLKNLRLSERLENLNEEALFQTFLLTDVKLPDSLKTIGQGALHLAAIRDIVIPAGVEFIDQEAFAWPLRTLKYLEEGVRTQGNAISVELSEELDPILQENISINKGVYIPRTITVLSRDAEYDDGLSLWNSDLSWIPVEVNYIKDSTTQKIIDGGYANDTARYTYRALDMSAIQAKVNLMSATERVPVTADTTEKDIEKFLQDEFYSSVVLDDLKVTNLEIAKPTDTADGSLGATVTVSTSDGGKIQFDFTRKLTVKPAFTVDMNKGGWTDEEFIYDNKFSPNITRFDDEIVTEYVEVPVEVEIGKGSAGGEEVVTTTTIIKRRRKKSTADDGSMLPVIIISVVAAFIVIAAGVLTLILVRRKKKKAQV